MESPMVVYDTEGANDRAALDDITSLRLTPCSTEDYRCPVSTPSNFVQRQNRIRRTRPLQAIYSQPPTAGGRSHRSQGTDVSRKSRNTSLAARSWAPKVRGGMEYYFVDKKGDRRDAEQTNNHWLRALCAQPVDEILNKYRRKSDVRRTRVIWSKTFTTPGEKSLLNAWENSTIKGRGQKARSALVGGARARMGGECLSAKRLTQSEPPLSRAQNYEIGGSLSPGRISNDPRSPDGHNEATGSPNRPPKIKGFLLDESTAGSRVTVYTTQYYAPKTGAGGPVYSKTAADGPDALPRMSNRHKVVSMLYNTHLYSKGGARASSHGSSLPRSPTPIMEDDDVGKDETQEPVSQN